MLSAGTFTLAFVLWNHSVWHRTWRFIDQPSLASRNSITRGLITLDGSLLQRRARRTRVPAACTGTETCQKTSMKFLKLTCLFIYSGGISKTLLFYEFLSFHADKARVLIPLSAGQRDVWIKYFYSLSVLFFIFDISVIKNFSTYRMIKLFFIFSISKALVRMSKKRQ